MFTGNCAKSGLQLAKSFEQFDPIRQQKISHQIIITGDAGHSKGISPKMMHMMEQLSAEAGTNSTLLLLGDNINSISENKSPQNLDTQANLLLAEMANTFKGQTYYIPGDLEWRKNNQAGVDQIEKWWQDHVEGDEDTFIPDDGCPGPEVEELTDKLVLIAFDSRWFIENWNRNEIHNESCDIRNRDDLLLELRNEIKSYYHTHNIILAMHHPVFSTGRRGGYSCFKDHIFPFSDIDGHIPIPLPVLGSAITFLKKKIPGRQDILHPVYQELAKTIDHFNRDYPGMIVVSAHDFNLQYLRDKVQHYIVSGALVDHAPVSLSDSAFFTYGNLGVARLNIFDDGSVDLEFIRPDAQANPEIIFRRNLKNALPTVEEMTPEEFPLFNQVEDSITTTVIIDERVKRFNTTIWGELNTELFYTPVKMPILNLDTAKGGLEPFRRGGSNQTNSVRLRDSLGQLYQIRSIKKNPDKLVPYPFNKTFLTNFADKQLTAGNPYGAFTLAPMEEAIGIYHSNPELFYIPKQPALVEYNDLGNQVYLLEERPDEDWSSLDSYGNAKNIIGHFNFREDLFKNHKTKVDQPLALRSRLFDMLIGDWDRHDDQWRWAEFEKEDGTVLYQVVPRDRDQTYAIYGGLIPNYARTTLPFFQALQRFEEDIKPKNVIWLNRQARNFDRLYLNELEWPVWEQEVKQIQKNITDNVINEAVNRFPSEIKAKGIDQDIAQKLRSRRDNLLQTARIYYNFLYKKVEVPSTHQDNVFEVERLNDEKTIVKVYELRDDENKRDLIYERVFSTNITEEIILYGLDGDDTFIVKGDVNKGPKIRLVGGNGSDTFEDYSHVRGLVKKTLVYDVRSETSTLKTSSETANRLSNKYKFNHYRYKGHKLNYGFIVPTFGFNNDEGFLLNALFTGKTYSYRQTQDHNLFISYAFGNQGVEFNYSGVYSDVFGELALTVNAIVRRPKFVFNFFGFGNDTEREFDDINFYRVSQEQVYFAPGIRRYLYNSTQAYFSFQPTFDRIKIRRLKDDFLSDNLTQVNPQVFETQTFLGAKLGFTYQIVDKPTFPRRGIYFDSNLSWNNQVTGENNHYYNVGGKFGFYQPIGRNSGAVIASQLGFEHLIGDFNLYYATRIGGNTSLRGFSNERFTGRTSFYHITDIRASLFMIPIAKLPTTFGVTAGFDYGRVWIDNENSEQWHTSYGGQIWLCPYDYFVLSTGLFFSQDGSRLSVRFGFDF
jgi:hypothetical protein